MHIMSARLASGHLLFKWFALCLVLAIIFILYLPERSVEIDSTMRANTRLEFALPTPGVNFTSPTVETPKYFVNTSQCKIPYIDPFTAEAMKIYSPRTFIPCSNESDLVSALYDVNLRRYILHINEPVAQKLLNSSEQEYNCFYREIQHGKNPETYDM